MKRQSPTTSLLAIALLLAVWLPVDAPAQQKKKTDKRVYCWDEGGRRVCSDTLPASAVGHQRTEINARTGTALNRISRALTPAEEARRLLEQQADEIEAVRRRRDMAMVVSYETEADLQRAFRERFELVEESQKTSTLAMSNLQLSLISLLHRANELELESKPVDKRLLEKIRNQHEDLLSLQALLARQKNERASLDQEFAAALSRYRSFKQGGDPNASPQLPLPQSSPQSPSQTRE